MSQGDPNLTITFRRLGVEDYDAIMTVWRAAGLHVRPTGRESRESFTTQMASGVQTALGAEIAGKLVGAVLANHDSRRGWINRLGIDPAWQRRGIGRALITECEKVLKAQGLTIVAALVEHHNAASLALFKAAGYALEPTYYLTKRDSQDA